MFVLIWQVITLIYIYKYLNTIQYNMCKNNWIDYWLKSKTECYSAKLWETVIIFMTGFYMSSDNKAVVCSWREKQRVYKDGQFYLETLHTVLHPPLIQLIDEISLLCVLPSLLQRIKHDTTKLLNVVLVPSYKKQQKQISGHCDSTCTITVYCIVLYCIYKFI